MEKSGKSSSSNSTSSRPELYEHITLLLADPEKQFPEEFDPQHPFKVRVMEKASRQGFVDRISRVNGEAVVPLESFNPQALVDLPALDVELRHGATYIVVPCVDMQDTGRRVSEWAVFRFLS
jgi:hypothetical protein